MQLYTKLHKKIVYSTVLCYGALIPLKCALFWCRCLLLMHFGTACFGLGGFLLFEIWEPACIAVILIHIKCPLVQMQMFPDAKSFSVWDAFCFQHVFLLSSSWQNASWCKDFFDTACFDSGLGAFVTFALSRYWNKHVSVTVLLKDNL